MSVNETTYYGLTRLREQGPEAKDWASVDRNPEILSRLLKAFQNHAHTGAAGIQYPGAGTPPVLPTLTELTTGGVLTPGLTIGVRLSYVDANGLETDASSETTATLSAAAARPLTPTLTSTQVAASALPGGTYIYVMTKKKASGETTMSDALPVSIPYDNTYSVTLGFSPISSYSDGTTALNIYRSTGLSNQFQLITSVTTGGATSFTDTNTIPSGYSNIQPPSNNTFNATRKLRIDWSAITIPGAAVKLRVYVTQQAGLWSTDHLLVEVDLATATQNYYDYLGSETLGSGWPINSSQVISMPGKIDLGTQATGAPILTADMDFAGFKAKNMVLGTTSVSTNGAIWYDNSANKFKGYIAGSVVDISQLIPLKNWIWNPSAETDAANFQEFGNTSVITTRVADSTGSGAYTFKIGKASGYAAPSIQAAWLQNSPNATSNSQFTTTALPNLSSQVPVSPGDVIGGTVAYRFDPATPITSAPNAPALMVGWWNSSNVYISSSTLGTGGTPATSASMTTLSGTGTAPANAAYAALYFNVPNVLTGTIFDLRLDKAFITKLPSVSTPFSYFDGDTVGAAWAGTAHASASAFGGYQHALEEAGGHKAQNITFGTSNVGTILSRIANTSDGSRKQVQTVQQVLATVSSPSYSGTSWAGLPEMQITVTPDFIGQWVELVFQGSFQINQASGTLSVGIDKDGDFIPGYETIVAQTAPVDNAYLAVVLHRHFQTTTSPQTFYVCWMTSSGATVSAVSLNRSLVAKLVF